MKITTILSVLILLTVTGCSVAPSVETLETHALLTGDWSKVESRERSLARRVQRRGPSCPGAMTAVCVDQFHRELCSCMEADAVRLMLSSY